MFDRHRQELDAGLIQMQLNHQAAKYIDRLSVLAQVDSTSTWVKNQPEPGVIACLAETQTGGRGRRGRSWASPVGTGVLLSVRALLPQTHALQTLSLRMGLAVLTAIQQVTMLQPKLKWPNDVMLNGSKLAGILVELQTGNATQSTVIVGVGINVRWPDTEQMPQPLADCRDACIDFTRNQLAAAVLNQITDVLMQYDQTPICSVIAQWWQHDILAGQQVQVEQADKLWIGRAAGIAEDGGFVLETDTGVKTFHSSEVSIRLVGSC